MRRKEVRDAKFQYASITFDTFKPTPAEQGTAPSPSSPSRDQPGPDQEAQHDHRLPSFARNFNPKANRAMLARSYELVTPVAASGAANSGKKPPLGPGTSGNLQQEEYDKLVHQERKMTGASQRNFSISTRAHNMPRTNYSLLEKMSKDPLANGETAELGVRKIKPTIKKRTLIKNTEKPLSKIPSYSMVQKPKAPPLPPRYDQEEVAKEEAEEEHYKVPRSVYSRERATAYDRPASLVRVARSCENIRSQSQRVTHTSVSDMSHKLYDTPTVFPRGRSQHSLVHHDNEPLYTNSIREVLQNSISVGSYIDMTGSQVSYI